MKPRTRNILIITGAVVVTGLAVGIPAFIYYRKKKNEGEVIALTELARQEGKLSSEEVQRIRFLYNLKNYELPAAYQTAWNNSKARVQAAISSFRSGNLQQAYALINNISQTLPASVKPDFEKAYQLFIELTSAMMNLDAKAKHDSWLIKSATIGHQVNSVMKWNFLAPPLMLVAYINTWTGVDKSLQEYAAIKNNPIYLVMKKIIFDKNYNFNTLKIFDLIWQLAKGENFFSVNAKSVSLN